MKLTVSTHSDGDAFFETTVLTSVSVIPDDSTLLTFRARPVVDLLLDGATEEALAAFTSENTVMEPAGSV